jgi:hypothetical protein
MIDVNKFDTHTLAKIWCTINGWEWAEELGNKPEGWDNMLNYTNKDDKGTKSEIITPIMNIIQDKIGHKECLRYHNVVELNYTNQEFEDWWNSRLV